MTNTGDFISDPEHLIGKFLVYNGTGFLEKAPGDSFTTDRERVAVFDSFNAAMDAAHAHGLPADAVFGPVQPLTVKGYND